MQNEGNHVLVGFIFTTSLTKDVERESKTTNTVTLCDNRWMLRTENDRIYSRQNCFKLFPERASQNEGLYADQFDYPGHQFTKEKEISRLLNSQFSKIGDFAEWMSTRWKQPYREYKYICFDPDSDWQKKMDADWLNFLNLILVKLVVGHSWRNHTSFWWSAQNKPKMLRTKCEQWIKSDNIWYQRSKYTLYNWDMAGTIDFP